MKTLILTILIIAGSSNVLLSQAIAKNLGVPPMTASQRKQIVTNAKVLAGNQLAQFRAILNLTVEENNQVYRILVNYNLTDKQQINNPRYSIAKNRSVRDNLLSKVLDPSQFLTYTNTPNLHY